MSAALVQGWGQELVRIVLLYVYDYTDNILEGCSDRSG